MMIRRITDESSTIKTRIFVRGLSGSFMDMFFIGEIFMLSAVNK